MSEHRRAFNRIKWLTIWMTAFCLYLIMTRECTENGTRQLAKEAPKVRIERER